MNIRSYQWVIHLFIQLILPLILVQLIVGANNTITDRTTHPWGFFAYRAHPATVFLPLHKPYATVLKQLGLKYDYEWEAFAFIGLVALIGFITGVYQMIIRIRKKQPWWKVSENTLIATFFWASVASLLLSFSIPFNMGLTFLLDYLGPIQQLRALSRFSWLFFYLINILVFYGLFGLMQRGIRMKILGILALTFLIYDGYLNMNQYAPRLNNRIPELDDTANLMPENAWLATVHPENYQAVLPLPYFHVGSENVWLESKCDMMRQSLIVSLKSGLPSMGVALSRTSISQTYKSLALASIPVSTYRIEKDLPNQKPLLLMVDNCNELNPSEKNLVGLASLVWQGPNFSMYSFPVGKLDSLAAKGQELFKNEMNDLYNGKVDSTRTLYFNGFENTPVHGAFAGSGAFSGEMKNWNNLLNEKLANGLPGDSCEVLFWAKGFETDLFARSNFEFVQKNGEQTVNYKYDQFQRYFCSLKDGWMRIRIPFVLKTASDQVMLSVRNEDLKHFQLVVDDLMIRKKTQRHL